MTVPGTHRLRRDGGHRAGWRRSERRLLTAAAVGLLFVLRFGLLFGLGPFKVLAVLLGGWLLVLTQGRPWTTARIAIVWIPLSPVLLSLAYKVGAPIQLVDMGAYLRALLVFSLALAGWRHQRALGRPLEGVDRLGLAYLGVCVVYLAAGPFLEASPLTLITRLQGLQAVAVFVVAFLAMRWLAPPPAVRDSLLRWAAAVIGLIAIVGVYQKLDRTGFNRLMLDWIDLDRYFREVTVLSPAAYSDAILHFFAVPLRVISLSLSPFPYADLMLVAVALGALRAATSWNATALALMGLGSVGVFLSGTRIAILALGAALVTLIVSRGMSELAKVRFVALAVVGCLALAPLLLSSRLVGEEHQEDTSVSNDGHVDELTTSLRTIVERPLGGGVGSDGAVSRRYSTTRTLVSGNTVLSIGLQLGVLGLAVFLAFFVAVVQQARRADRALELRLFALVVLVGSFVSGMTHSNWQEASVGPMTWLLLGLALPSVAARSGTDASARAESASRALV